MSFYEKRTVKYLKSIAKDKNIKGYSLCNKKDIISLLRKDIKSCKKKSPKGVMCCYKSSKKTVIKCSKKNPSPPCKVGFYSKKSPKGVMCCYKSPKKTVKKSLKIYKPDLSKGDCFERSKVMLKHGIFTLFSLKKYNYI